MLMGKESMNRVRPNISDSSVGYLRYERYKQAINRYNDAMEHCYYIEAISLAESLICDRLESLYNDLSQSSRFSYKALECFFRTPVYKHIKASYFHLFESIEAVKEWKVGRNQAIHEMAKLREDCSSSFDADYAKLKSVAENGMKCFRNLDKAISKYRK